MCGHQTFKCHLEGPITDPPNIGNLSRAEQPPVHHHHDSVEDALNPLDQMGTQQHWSLLTSNFDDVLDQAITSQGIDAS